MRRAAGHILVEDYPGVGKTALARGLSRSIDCQFARVQCTADLLPADIVGTNVYNQREARFEFRPGPIFANIVIVDEINRASPKTQSGLLECMQERQVTVDATSHELARPFLVFATQNPVEYEGTYPLPEAQVDRFMVRVSLGYPDAQHEAGMLAGHEARDRVLDLEAVADRSEVVDSVEAAHHVHASRALRDYIVALLRHTRADSRVELGASPRAELLYVTGSALALLGLGAWAWIGVGAWGADVHRELSARSVLEEQPLAVRITASAGRLPLPPGWIDEPLLPEPVRFQAGRRAARVRVEVTFGRRGRRRLPPPAPLLRDPFRLAPPVRSG